MTSLHSSPASANHSDATWLRWKLEPARFVREAIGAEPQEWQEKALNAIAANDRVAIRSGHGAGKSSFLSWLIFWFMLTRFPAKIPCTAPTEHQLNDVLWSELAKWHRAMAPSLAELLEIKKDRIELKAAPNESFAVARTARKEKPEAFQGFHSENLLLLGDEASGIDDKIFEVGEGAMSTAGAKTVLTGNPTRTSGYFWAAFNERGTPWERIHVRYEDCKYAPQKYRDDMARKYGVDSNVFRVRVLGEFPKSDDKSVVPLSWCEAAVDRDIQPVTGYRTVWGVSVGMFMSDPTALAKRRWNVLLEPAKEWRNKEPHQIAELLMDEFTEAVDTDANKATDRNWQQIEPHEIIIDEMGLGADVLAKCRDLGLPVRGINTAETKTASERFMRLRDRLWWKGRAWFEKRDCIMPDDEDLTAQLCEPQYDFTPTKKIQVEDRKDLDKRNVPPPAKAEAFCLTMAGGIQKLDANKTSRYGARRKKSRPYSAWAA